MLSKSTLRRLALVAALGLLAPATALPVPITYATNPQYFFYKNKTTALVGISAEYLCHMEQMPDKMLTADGRTVDRDRHYCTYDITAGRPNYQRYIDDIAGRGLNKMRLWVGLNHSPGAQPTAAAVPSATPYPVEQPFLLRPDGKWDLTQFVDEYFTRVFNVVSYASTKDVIVEVTLFDAYSPDWTKGPWNQSRNANDVGKAVYFTNKDQFTAYESIDHDTTDAVKNAREQQKEFVRRMAARLNNLENFYWEVSNEPDLGNSPAPAAVVNFHLMIADVIKAAELNKKKHLIAVNYHRPETLGTLAGNDDLRVVSSHYVDILDGPVRFGAIEMIRNYHNGGTSELNKIFGFNEGRIYPTTDDADILSARAEAWEFMFNEGGSFDHLGYEWNLTSTVYPNPSILRAQLGVLSKFLNGTTAAPSVVSLRNMGRVMGTGSPPGWVQSGLPAYGQPGPRDSNSLTYWGAMFWVRNQYLLYIHHSVIYPGPPDKPPQTFRRYQSKPGSYSESLRLYLGNLPGCFKADWVNPATGADISTTYIGWDPTTMPGYDLPPPPTPYSYDIVLRVVKQSAQAAPCP